MSLRMDSSSCWSIESSSSCYQPIALEVRDKVHAASQLIDRAIPAMEQKLANSLGQAESVLSNQSGAFFCPSCACHKTGECLRSSLNQMLVHAAPIQNLQGQVAQLDQEHSKLASTAASNQREIEELAGNLENWHLFEAKENSDPSVLGGLKREAEALPKKLEGALKP